MFDNRANGYARGEGIGTIIMKPLADALRNNDPIHAIIRNTGMNQDGKTPRITLPSPEAQHELMKRTYREVRLDLADTDLLEAHGTGTVAGDKVEAEALALGLETTRRAPNEPLKVVSVKTKIGHCEAASGIAGIIHSIVALQTRTIFPNCNFKYPSSEINFKDWKIKVRITTHASRTDHSNVISGSNKLAALDFRRTSKGIRKQLRIRRNECTFDSRGVQFTQLAAPRASPYKRYSGSSFELGAPKDPLHQC